MEWQSAPIHAVALPLNRLPPPRRLFGGHPQQAALRQASASSSAQGPALSTRQLRACELSAEEYIEFLAASSLTCSIRAMPKSSKVWTDITKRRSHLDTLDVPKTPSYDVLRRTRIRFDIALMLAFRLWFQNLISSGVPFFLFVYMDASPQWRGRELFAASIDVVRIVDGERLYSRHLLPLINLGTAYRSSYGKTWAFLWMLVLVCGGKYN